MIATCSVIKFSNLVSGNNEESLVKVDNGDIIAFVFKILPLIFAVNNNPFILIQSSFEFQILKGIFMTCHKRNCQPLSEK